MNTDESYLHNRFGNDRPFKVPSGYFDDFKGRMKSMAAASAASEAQESELKVLPLKRSNHNNQWIRWVAAAAILALVVFSVVAIVGIKPDGAQLADEKPAVEKQGDSVVNTSDANAVRQKTSNANTQLAMVSPSETPVKKKKAVIRAERKAAAPAVSDSVAVAPKYYSAPVSVSVSSVSPSAIHDESSDIEKAADFMMMDNDALYLLLSEYE